MARKINSDPGTIKAQAGEPSLTWAFAWERVTGIEPALSAWEADVLPLNYTRADRAGWPQLAPTSYRNLRPARRTRQAPPCGTAPGYAGPPASVLTSRVLELSQLLPQP